MVRAIKIINHKIKEKCRYNPKIYQHAISFIIGCIVNFILIALLMVR